MNVTSLFFATNTAQGGGSGTSRKEVSESVFAEVFSQTMAQTTAPAPVKEISSQEIPWEDAVAQTVNTEEVTEEAVVEQIIAMLAQAMQAVSPKDSEVETSGENVTMNLNFSVENKEQLENLVKDLHALFAQLGFSQEDIQKAIKVNMSAEELGPELSALVTPSAQLAEDALFQQEQTISLSLKLTLPKAAFADFGDQEAPMTMAEALNKALGEVQKSLESQKRDEASKSPEVPAVNPGTLAQVSGTHPNASNQETEKEAPEKVQANSQIPVATTSSETTEEAVLVIKTDNTQKTTAEPTASKDATEALRALARVLAENAKDGVTVEVEVRNANQDQDLAQEMAQVTEEARVVLEQKAVEQTQLTDGEKADLLVMALQKRKLEGVLSNPIAPQSLAELAKLPSELKDLNARISLTESGEDLQLEAEAKARKLTLGNLAGGAYGQALGRLVKFQPVSNLLKDLSVDSASTPNPGEDTGALSGETAHLKGDSADSSFAFDLSQAAFAADRGGVVLEKALPRDIPVPVKETWTLPQSENEARQALISKLSNKVQHLAASGAVAHEVRIALKPEHLGDLRIRMETHEGSVKATFVVESQRVKEILQSGFNALKNDLQEAGMKLENFQVSVRDDRPAQQFAWGREGGQDRPGQQHSGKGGNQPAFNWEARSQSAIAELEDSTVNVFV